MYNLGLSLVCLICTLSIVLITKRLGKNSARHMVAQQESIANMEVFIEETLNGQKVVKSFVHEKETKKNFQVFNERLFRDGNKANFFGGLIDPILRACGNFAYVVLALLGSLLILINPNNTIVFM